MGKMLKGDDGADLDSSFVLKKFEIEEGQENLDYMLRFTNVGRLYERITSATVAGSSLQRLRKSHVCIIGLGGVGSWVVESLARSGIGRMTLVDMDEVCISNVNRQLCAVSSSVGKFKADVLKNRVLDINPYANVSVIIDFITSSNVDSLVSQGTFDYVVDAADGVSDKAAIVHQCVVTETPVVCSGGVGGLLDPSLLLTSDLATAKGDGLLMRVRKKLRQDYGYRQEKGKLQKKRVKSWQVMTVHTSPTGFKRGGDANSDLKDDQSGEDDSSACSVSESSTSGGFRQCDVMYGSGTFITGTVGFMLSGIVVNAIALGQPLKPRSLQWMTQRRNISGDHTTAAYDSSDDEDYDDSREKSGNLGANTALPREEKYSATNSEVPIRNKKQNAGEHLSEDSSFEDDILCETISPQKEMSFSALSNPLFDAHCHIQLSPLYAVAGQAIEQSKTLGITKAAVCGTCPGDDWDRILLLHQQHPDFILPQFGLHPWYIQRYAESLLSNSAASSSSSSSSSQSSQDRTTSLHSTATMGLSSISEPSLLLCAETLTDLLRHQLRQQLELMLTSCGTAGVGECGLDRNIIAAVKTEKASNQQSDESKPIWKSISSMMDMDLQMKILGWHLEIAAKYRRPVTIHCVSGCWDHLLRLFKDKEIATAVTSGRIPAIILHSCHSLPVDMLPAFFSAVGDTFALNKLALSPNSTTKKKAGNEKRKPYSPLPEFQIVESSSSRSSSSEVLAGDESVTIVEEGKDEDSHCRLYFSMSGRIFGSPKGIRLARTVPFKRLLLESDSPDQLPVPYIRKKSTSDSKSGGGSGGDSRKHSSERDTLSYNQPGTLTYTCVEMAKQLDVSCELMAKQTNENARKAYRTCIP